MSYSNIFIKSLIILVPFFAASGLLKTLVSFFEIRIYKFNRRIDIATKLLENATLKSDEDIKTIALKIVNDSLFGLNYLVNISGEQKNTISNMIESGLTKGGVIEAVYIINKATGKLGGRAIKIITHFIFFLYLVTIGLLFFALIYSSYKLINNDFSTAERIVYFNGLIALTKDQTLSLIILVFILIVMYWYIAAKYLLRINILNTYDHDGKPITAIHFRTIKIIFDKIILPIKKSYQCVTRLKS
ncbi:hypothetical protein HAP94_24270 [Acidithiobacillus ferrivorans]|nr:hypothetical protein [Acidithiobacillus ferrivorans]